MKILNLDGWTLLLRFISAQPWWIQDGSFPTWRSVLITASQCHSAVCYVTQDCMCALNDSKSLCFASWVSSLEHSRGVVHLFFFYFWGATSDSSGSLGAYSNIRKIWPKERHFFLLCERQDSLLLLGLIHDFQYGVIMAENMWENSYQSNIYFIWFILCVFFCFSQ